MKSSKLPYVIFFDIDGTLIGDIAAQVCEWSLLKTYDSGKLSQFKKNLIVQLSHGLLRPNLSNYIDFLKMRHDRSELYIYTASDPKWAAFLIPCIEAVSGVKFNRPIFARNHCLIVNQEIKKSLAKVLPKVLVKLKREYESISLSDLKHQSILIDNNHVLLKNESSKCILCPSYTYSEMYDSTRLISEDILHNNFVEISMVLATYGMFPNISNTKQFSYQVFKALYFNNLGKNITTSISQLKLNDSSSSSTVKKPDQFWNRLGSVMSKMEYTNLKDSVIRSINHGVSSKL